MHKNHLEPVPSLPPIPNSKFIKKFGRSHKEQDKLPVNQSNTSYAPKEPIENDPHLFDLLLNDSLHFIHYGKTDSTVTSATVEKLVEKLTREMNYDFLMDFFLTFRQYLTPIKLCKLLISRFRWTLLEETDERQLIRIRTFVVIRHWLTHYWTHDFMNSHTLRFMLCTFLTQLRTHPAILTSPRNERIVSNLRKIMKRQRRFYRHLDTNDQQREPSWTGKLGRTIRKSASFSVYNHSLLCKPFHMDLCHSKLLSLITHQDNYKSVVLKYRSEIIAQQFCLIEKDMLQTVSWDELIELRWRKKGSSTRHSVVQDTNLKGVELLIDFFNKTCQWVTCEIVRSTLLETRVQVIEKFIRIAFKCYQHRNYSTLMQILLGLQSPAVTRLERTWERVNQVQKDLLNQLKELAKPFKNWKNIRDCMTKATEEVTESFAVECVLTQSLKGFEHVNGCIPFLGLYLSDLVFLAELPTFIKANADTNNEDYIEHDKKLYERLCHPLVNYNKFRITASVIKHVLTFQVLSRAYKFKIHQHLFTQLQTVSILDNSQIREASFLCE